MLPFLFAGAVLPAPLPKAKRQHCVLTLEGEVKQGESFRRPGPAGLDFLLEAIPSGWIVRMLDRTAPRGEFDYAGLATPPYMSPNPILISTDFSFRAQDAIGWNPRGFQYFRNHSDMERATAAYRDYLSAVGKTPSPRSQSGLMALLKLSSSAAPAKLEILDAHLVGGTNNQTAAAALVASRFLTTAHVVEAAPPGPHPLGQIRSLQFRVSFPEQNVACKDTRNPRH